MEEKLFPYIIVNHISHFNYLEKSSPLCGVVYNFSLNAIHIDFKIHLWLKYFFSITDAPTNKTYKRRFVNRSPDAIPIQEKMVLTRLECAVACEANPICNAFALNTTTTNQHLNCRLHGSGYDKFESNFIDAPGVHYWDKD